jgi:hypothetical protein
VKRFLNNKNGSFLSRYYSNSTSHAFESKIKTLFVKLMNVKEVKANIVCLDKGKISCLNNCVKPK